MSICLLFLGQIRCCQLNVMAVYISWTVFFCLTPVLAQGIALIQVGQHNVFSGERVRLSKHVLWNMSHVPRTSQWMFKVMF